MRGQSCCPSASLLVCLAVIFPRCQKRGGNHVVAAELRHAVCGLIALLVLRDLCSDEIMTLPSVTLWLITCADRS